MKSIALKKNTFQLFILLLCSFSTAFGQLNKNVSTKESTYRIMPLGDSKTEGGGGGSQHSWRGYLRAQLIENGYLLDYVGDRSNTADGDAIPNDNDHAGHGGYTIGPDIQRWSPTSETTGIAEHIKYWMRLTDPDIVILNIGVNDFFNSDKHPENYAATAPVRYQSLIDSIISSPNKQLQLILCTIEPVKWNIDYGTDPDDNNLGALNAKIREIASADANDNIYLADVQSDFLETWSELDFWDDIHLSQIGATKVANTIYNILSGLIDTIPAANIRPTVAITSPLHNTLFTTADTIDIAVDADDADGTIEKVELYFNNDLLTTLTTSPYNYAWEQPTEGFYNIEAIATDNSGATVTSSVIRIKVETITGFEKIKLNEIKIGPNPVPLNYPIMIQLAELNPNASVSFFQCSGVFIRKVLLNTLSSTITMEGFKPGVYLVYIDNGNEKDVKKIVVK